LTTPLLFEAPWPANIRISLILLETAIPGLHVEDSMGLSSFKFLWWAPKDMCVMQQSA